MKKQLLIIFSCLSSFAFAQNSLSWYKQIDGTVDKYPVTLHLHKAGHNYNGYYYYNSQEKPIYFIGEDTTIKGKINLMAFATNDATETFSLLISGAAVTGTWKKDEQSNALSFIGTATSSVVPLTYVYAAGEKKLRPQMKESPQASFFAGSIWPTGTSQSSVFLKKAVLKIYDEKATSTEIGKLMLRNKNNFLKGYENDFKDVKPAELEESSTMYNIDELQSILMVYQSPKMATIANYIYTYSGGAHGNYATNYFSYDLASKKQLQLADIITPEGKKKLPPLLAKALRSQFGLKTSDALTEVLFEDKIAPNKNFYVTGKGIGFSYAPYEVAAYAYGEINLFIPFKEIGAGLQPSFKKLLQ